jgi:hypothetical protein
MSTLSASSTNEAALHQLVVVFMTLLFQQKNLSVDEAIGLGVPGVVPTNSSSETTKTKSGSASVASETYKSKDAMSEVSGLTSNHDPELQSTVGDDDDQDISTRTETPPGVEHTIEELRAVMAMIQAAQDDEEDCDEDEESIWSSTSTLDGSYYDEPSAMENVLDQVASVFGFGEILEPLEEEQSFEDSEEERSRNDETITYVDDETVPRNGKKEDERTAETETETTHNPTSSFFSGLFGQTKVDQTNITAAQPRPEELEISNGKSSFFGLFRTGSSSKQDNNCVDSSAIVEHPMKKAESSQAYKTSLGTIRVAEQRNDAFVKAGSPGDNASSPETTLLDTVTSVTSMIAKQLEKLGKENAKSAVNERNDTTEETKKACTVPSAQVPSPRLQIPESQETISFTATDQSRQLLSTHFGLADDDSVTYLSTVAGLNTSSEESLEEFDPRDVSLDQWLGGSATGEDNSTETPPKGPQSHTAKAVKPVSAESIFRQLCRPTREDANTRRVRSVDSIAMNHSSSINDLKTVEANYSMEVELTPKDGAGKSAEALATPKGDSPGYQRSKSMPKLRNGVFFKRIDPSSDASTRTLDAPGVHSDEAAVTLALSENLVIEGSFILRAEDRVRKSRLKAKSREHKKHSSMPPKRTFSDCEHADKASKGLQPGTLANESVLNDSTEGAWDRLELPLDEVSKDLFKDTPSAISSSATSSDTTRTKPIKAKMAGFSSWMSRQALYKPGHSGRNNAEVKASDLSISNEISARRRRRESRKKVVGKKDATKEETNEKKDGLLKKHNPKYDENQELSFTLDRDEALEVGSATEVSAMVLDDETSQWDREWYSSYLPKALTETKQGNAQSLSSAGSVAMSVPSSDNSMMKYLSGAITSEANAHGGDQRWESFSDSPFFSTEASVPCHGDTKDSLNSSSVLRALFDDSSNSSITSDFGRKDAMLGDSSKCSRDLETWRSRKVLKAEQVKSLHQKSKQTRVESTSVKVGGIGVTQRAREAAQKAFSAPLKNHPGVKVIDEQTIVDIKEQWEFFNPATVERGHDAPGVQAKTKRGFKMGDGHSPLAVIEADKVFEQFSSVSQFEETATGFDGDMSFPPF